MEAISPLLFVMGIVILFLFFLPMIFKYFLGTGEIIKTMKLLML